MRCLQDQLAVGGPKGLSLANGHPLPSNDVHTFSRIMRSLCVAPLNAPMNLPSGNVGAWRKSLYS